MCQLLGLDQRDINKLAWVPCDFCFPIAWKRNFFRNFDDHQHIQHKEPRSFDSNETLMDLSQRRVGYQSFWRRCCAVVTCPLVTFAGHRERYTNPANLFVTINIGALTESEIPSQTYHIIILSKCQIAPWDWSIYPCVCVPGPHEKIRIPEFKT